MGKYDPLAAHLSSLPKDAWHPSFDEIEAILGFDLPPSARKHQSWWGNCYRGTHSQAKGWVPAGWETRDIDLREQTVRFERAMRHADSRGATTELLNLWTRARDISGITDQAELEKAAVTEFIHREAGKRLIALGGSDPNASAPPRRRPPW